MAFDHILALLLSQRSKLTNAIEALQGPTKRKGRPPGSGRKAVLPSVEQDSPLPERVAPIAPAKRKLSAAGRRAIVAATKKRWAAIKAAKAAAAAPATTKAVRSPALAAAKQKASSAKNAAFHKKMSEPMKAAWAVRKKKTVG
jgi:hypothetical protein